MLPPPFLKDYIDIISFSIADIRHGVWQTVKINFCHHFLKRPTLFLFSVDMAKVIVHCGDYEAAADSGAGVGETTAALLERKNEKLQKVLLHETFGNIFYTL